MGASPIARRSRRGPTDGRCAAGAVLKFLSGGLHFVRIGACTSGVSVPIPGIFANRYCDGTGVSVRSAALTPARLMASCGVLVGLTGCDFSPNGDSRGSAARVCGTPIISWLSRKVAASATWRTCVPCVCFATAARLSSYGAGWRRHLLRQRNSRPFPADARSRNHSIMPTLFFEEISSTGMPGRARWMFERAESRSNSTASARSTGSRVRPMLASSFARQG